MVTTDKKEDSFKPVHVLNDWVKKGRSVTFTLFGDKAIRGKIVSVGRYDLTIIPKGTTVTKSQREMVLFKHAIVSMEVIKNG